MEPTKHRAPGGGRPRVFDDKTIQYIKDNPDQLNYSELARKFSVCVQTIRRVALGRGAYKEAIDA